MCIPNEEECPINEIIVDLESNTNLYSSNYNITFLENLTEGYVLYYRNTATDKEIITKITLNNETPTYINSENFVFDKDTYQDYLDANSDDGVMMEVTGVVMMVVVDMMGEGVEVIVVEEVGED